MSPRSIVRRQERPPPLSPLQARFLKSGLSGFDDQEVIELFLSLCLPRGNHKKLAEKCLSQFKDLRSFLAASPEQLERAGIGLHVIFSIKLLCDLPSHVLKEKIIDQPVYASARELFDYPRYTIRDMIQGWEVRKCL